MGQWVLQLLWLPQSGRFSLANALEAEGFITLDQLEPLTEPLIAAIVLKHRLADWKPVFTKHLMTAIRRLNGSSDRRPSRQAAPQLSPRVANPASAPLPPPEYMDATVARPGGVVGGNLDDIASISRSTALDSTSTQPLPDGWVRFVDDATDIPYYVNTVCGRL